MILFLGLIIPLLSYLFEVYPRFFNKYYGVDVWMRMIEADLIRKNHHRIPTVKIKDGFIIEGYFYYPPGLSWLLSFIPKNRLLRMQGYISPVFDTLQNFVVYLIAYQLTGRVEIALVAQLIYATIPMLVLENSYLTPRSFGYLLFTLSLYLMILYSVSPNILYLILSVSSIVLVCFIHKFPIQSLLLVTIFFSIIEGTFLYIGIFLISLLIAAFVSKGHYLKILKEHLVNIYYWSQNFTNHYAFQFKKNDNKRKNDLVVYIYFLLSTFSPISLLITNIWTVGSFVFLAIHFSGLNLLLFDNIILFKMSLWVVFFYIVSILVLSVSFLRPIGEGQRYMEMATVPVAVLSSVVFFSLLNTEFRSLVTSFFVLVTIVNIALIIFLQWKLVIKDKSRSMSGSLQQAFKFINKLKFKPRIVCFPQQLAHMVVYNTKADVLIDFQATTGSQIEEVYPVLKVPIKQLAKKFNLNLLILKRNFKSAKELGLSKKSLLFETSDVLVYAL